MPTYEQAVTIVTCIAAAIAFLAIGKLAIVAFAALWRLLVTVFTAIKGVLVTALVGGVVVAVFAVAIIGVGVPKLTSTTTPAPRPTAVRVQQLDVELQGMSIMEAQRYGAGFRFINGADQSVCTLQDYEGQTWLVANCD